MTTTPAARPTSPAVASHPVHGRRFPPALRRRVPARTAARAGVSAFVLFVVSLEAATRGAAATGPLRLLGLVLACTGLALAAWAPAAAVAVVALGVLATGPTGAVPLGGYVATVAAVTVAARSDRRAGIAGFAALSGLFALGAFAPPQPGENDLPALSGSAQAGVLAVAGALAVLVGLLVPRRSPGAAPGGLPFLGRRPVLTGPEVLALAAVVAVVALRWTTLFGGRAFRFSEDLTVTLLSAAGAVAVIAVFSVATTAVALSPWFPRAGFAVCVAAHVALLAFTWPGRVMTVPGFTAGTVAALYVLARARLRVVSAEPGSARRAALALAGPTLLAAALYLTQGVADVVREGFARGQSWSDLTMAMSPARTVVLILTQRAPLSLAVPVLAVGAAWLVTRWLADRERLAVAAVSEAAVRERTRIARELHDVVAHHVSLVTVRAESAPFLVPDLPAPARDAFGDIASTSRRALDELRDVLGVLGRDDDVALAPQPTLADVPGLVRAAREAGADVRFDGLPDVGDVAAGTALAAHAVVREALSNARRHAPGEHVTVKLSADGGTLVVEVSNPATTTPGRDGLGLTGLRERTGAAGGTFAAGLSDGRFTVLARLPLRRPDAP